jgi:hypothetical protein
LEWSRRRQLRLCAKTLPAGANGASGNGASAPGAALGALGRRRQPDRLIGAGEQGREELGMLRGDFDPLRRLAAQFRLRPL